MKKQKLKSSRYKFKTIFALILIGATLIYFIFIGISIFKSKSDDINYSGIEIKTNSDTSIYVDNQKIGEAFPSESFINTKIDSGQKKIKLTKNSDTSINYERDIIFEKGTQVTIEWNFGVTSETSSGIVKYFVKKIESDNKIRIITSVSNCIILVDGSTNSSGIIPSDGQQHKIEISKDGYLSKSLTVTLVNNQIISDQISQSDKNKYDQYDLVVEISLFQIPFV